MKVERVVLERRLIAVSMTVTMKKVARRAGVSVSTVSRVLSGHANVREETSRKVRQTMEELGYTPNIIAQNLVSRTTHCICVLLPDMAEIWPANLYFMEVIRGIVLGAGKLGYDIQLASGDGEQGELGSVSRLLKGGRADGAILLSARRSSSVVDFLRQEGYPFVLVEDGPAAGSGGEMAADQYETDDGSASQTKVGRESAGGESNSLAGDGGSVSNDLVISGEYEADGGRTSLVEVGWEEVDSGSSSLVITAEHKADGGSTGPAEVGREEVDSGNSSLVITGEHKADNGGTGLAEVGRERTSEGARAMPAAVVPFPGMPDESVAQMGAMASELLIGSIQRRIQQPAPGGDAGCVAQFVLRRPVLSG